MKLDIIAEIEIPEGIEVKIEDSTISLSNENNKIERRFMYSNIEITRQGNKIIFSAKNATKREKRMMNTFKAHTNNMMAGMKKEYVYKLAICSSHFPMTVSVDKNDVMIKNFLGEKTPRKIGVIDGVKVSVEGNIIVVKGIDKEKTGMMAGRIEKLTKIKGRDKRVFQDGCYIIDKAGKLIR